MSSPGSITPPPKLRLSLLSAWRAQRKGWLDQFVRLQAEHGDLVELQLGRRRVFLLSDPALIHEVLALAKPVMKERGLQVNARLFLGDGLLTSQGETYKRQRQLSRPAVQAEHFPAQAAVIQDCFERTQSFWRDGESRDLARECADVTLRAAAESVLGVNLDPQLAATHAWLEEISEFARRAISNPLYFIYQHLPLPGPIRFRRARAGLNRMLEEALSASRGRPTWLGHLEAADSELTPVQIRDLAKSVLLAGYETTANALAWTLYLISGHPDVERQLLQEFAAAPPSAATDPLPALPYTLQVVRESMRLYPPVWIVGREALTDIALGRLQLRRGDTVYMSQYIVHRNPRHFPNPTHFDPDRFVSANHHAGTLTAYFPFGAGPRSCIGKQFALQELALGLRHWLPRWRFVIDRPEPIGLDAVVTLKPLGGLRMKVFRRTA